MKISVIIPCFNLGAYLEECVNSVLNQTRKDFEIIVVDDGSTDNETIAVIDKISPLVNQVIRTPNQGLVATRNLGISKSNGEYICCLDADDKYHPEFLEKTATILEQDQDKKIGFVTTWVQEFEGRNSIWQTSDYSPTDLMVNNTVHVASLFRKRCWEEVDGYQSNLRGYQDWNFWLSICGKGYEWRVIKESLFYYRIRQNSMITSSDKKRYELISTIIHNNRNLYTNNITEVIIKLQRTNDYKQAQLDELSRDLARCTESINKQLVELNELHQFKRSIKSQIVQILRLIILKITTCLTR